MDISGRGWELLVRRRENHELGTKKRTYGEYQVFLNGQPIAGLAGYMCESIGPGDNKKAGNGKRVEQGRYPIWTQFGRYRSIGYSESTQKAGAEPMPGIRLEGTGKRVGILIHPAHPPKLYLSSVGCFNPTAAVQANESINFWESRTRTIALIESLRSFSPASFEKEIMTRIADAWVVVDGEPTDMVAAAAEAMPAAAAQPASLPLSEGAARETARWLIDNFGDQMRTATNGKAYGVKHLCAIVCQETAYKWLKWTGDPTPEFILEHCVFDASGDYPGTSRSAFPKNTAAFRKKYGDEFTDMLIEEANKVRRLQGWSDKQWVYKGYGIFQYDLQHIETNRAFFEERKWRSFDECLARCCGELDAKLIAASGDLWQAIRRYNGSGPKAEAYMQNVKAFTEYCSQVTG